MSTYYVVRVKERGKDEWITCYDKEGYHIARFDNVTDAKTHHQWFLDHFLNKYNKGQLTYKVFKVCERFYEVTS